MNHEQLRSAIALIDRANDADPTTVPWAGVRVPRARLQGERATWWLEQLTPQASPEVQVACRAHHLLRWELARSSYPPGRAGYLRWRREQKKRHALALARLLADVGVDPASVERAAALVQRVGLGRDPEAQLVEDSACLAFCEIDLADLVTRLGSERTIGAVRATAAKVSAAALALMLDAAPPGPARSTIASALAAD